MNVKEKQYYSTTEAAKILKISRIAVFQKIEKGQIRAEKIGRNYIIPKEEILKSLGEVLGDETKSRIDDAVNKAFKEYGEVFRRLGEE